MFLCAAARAELLGRCPTEGEKVVRGSCLHGETLRVRFVFAEAQLRLHSADPPFSWVPRHPKMLGESQGTQCWSGAFKVGVAVR